MGGGDLNLKKSWHPQTLHNVERVWKAEQKQQAEQRKIDQLKQEIEEERAREEIQAHAVSTGVLRKKSNRLDWMYAAPGVSADREEYLLGKTLDNKLLNNDAKEEQNNPLTMPSSSSDVVNNPKDMAAKIREDPIFLMKKQEDSRKKELVQNPIKMKKLRELLHNTMDKKPKKHKKKKSKDHEKKHKDDNVRVHQDHHRSMNQHRDRERGRDISPSHRRRSEQRNGIHRDHRSRSRSPRRYHDNYNRRPRSKSPDYKRRDQERSTQRNYNRRQNNLFQNNDKNPQTKKKLSAEEMQKLREDMMSNAKWRDEQRESNVKKYKIADDEEKNDNGPKDAAFIRYMGTKIIISFERHAELCINYN
ncbi:uncharacterized protein TRIADDRAFT_54223 [Trichoplax adhaerens]|uniref:CBF1-interacting co-repressor CIR N-terminal domain-containing protein n=1 Tax=Trichoplax adhaerens TaxID=10228 RepID=B3RRF9_TRIAD|nr:hypothetical protein TRIADDRAFT_54223 [Trichoplax adhaerens]EDV26339.1 hypothetical protein TRIADDRAFT_54223 [Trichoplax adhaerens]|eukprot:XP_002110335.1 hypothetical protein TRIADDRAFT_54223 [Trichoplax adhaerens]